VLQSYLGKFDPAFIGLTGSAQELEPVWNLYGVYVDKNSPTQDAGYTLTHSNRVYLIDTVGNLRLTYSLGVSPDAFIQDIRHLLN
jgi:protein SCO1/2